MANRWGALAVAAGFLTYACSTSDGAGATGDGSSGAAPPPGASSSGGASSGSNGDGGPRADGGPATCTGCARDWNAYPAVVQVAGVSELWVTSDVHGDYKTFTTLLAGAKIIAPAPTSPAAVQWTGGTATLVIVGDLIDKGPD